ILGAVPGEPGGGDDGDVPSAPVRNAVQAIASEPWQGIDDGFALTDHPVEQGRLPDVRAADDRDDWPGHLSIRRVLVASPTRSAPRPRTEPIPGRARLPD